MRLSPLPPSMSTLVSRKPSMIGLRTKAAGARTVLNFGLSLALKVIAVLFQGFIAATWQTSARPRSALLCLLPEAKVLKTVNTVGLCSKAVGCHGIRRLVYYAWAIEPSLQNGAVQRNRFMFFDVWLRCLAIMRPFVSDSCCIQGRIVPEFIFGFRTPSVA